jgi:uncharacterized protein
MKIGKKRKKRILRVKKIAIILLSVFLILNILSYCGAYILTHFKTAGEWGLGLTRPNNIKSPNDSGLAYNTRRISIDGDAWLEVWSISSDNSDSKGTVLLFPGHQASKGGQLIAPARVFYELGYDTLLVDFRGVGGSSGNTTTLGIREARDVAAAMDYAQKSQLQQPFILYGVSMGSAAILTAIARNNLKPDGIILEMPFFTLIDAVRSRLRSNGIPAFPLAELVVLWGGIQHGFNGFAHNPIDYASKVKCPALILHGRLDRWTTVAQIDRLAQNLQGFKQSVIFPKAGHNLLVTFDRKYWQQSVDRFFKETIES